MTLLTKPQLKRLARINAELEEMLNDVKAKQVPTYSGQGAVGRATHKADVEAKECLEQNLRDSQSHVSGILSWLDR